MMAFLVKPNLRCPLKKDFLTQKFILMVGSFGFEYGRCFKAKIRLNQPYISKFLGHQNLLLSRSDRPHLDLLT